MLMHLFPDANIPVFQMSISYYEKPDYHYQLGKQLKALREKGVLIIGSGALIHNLPLASQKMMQNDMKAYGYTGEEVAELIRLSQRLYKKYQDAKKYYEIGLRSEILKGDLEIPEGMTEDELIKEKVEKWDELNNPNLYLDQLYNQHFHILISHK